MPSEPRHLHLPENISLIGTRAKVQYPLFDVRSTCGCMTKPDRIYLPAHGIARMGMRVFLSSRYQLEAVHHLQPLSQETGIGHSTNGATGHLRRPCRDCCTHARATDRRVKCCNDQYFPSIVHTKLPQRSRGEKEFRGK